MDLGMLRRVDEVWPSDNTDALDRQTIQDGFTQAYTAGMMMAWVTDVPNGINGRVVPLEFRFLVAMTGSLGFGGNLNKWSPEDMPAATKMVAFYKRIRPQCKGANCIGSSRPRESNFAIEYVSSNRHQTVLFAFLHSQQFGTPKPAIFLHGLAEDAMYM